jgi:hypothetical protein
VAGPAVNISYGEPQTVLELVGRITALMGRADLTPLILDEAQLEIIDQYLDATRACSSWAGHHASPSMRDSSARSPGIGVC